MGGCRVGRWWAGVEVSQELLHLLLAPSGGSVHLLHLLLRCRVVAVKLAGPEIQGR